MIYNFIITNIQYMVAIFMTVTPGAAVTSGGAAISGGMSVTAGIGATAICIGLSIAIVIIAVGVFFWLRNRS
jgi:hypothetical protein